MSAKDAEELAKTYTLKRRDGRKIVYNDKGEIISWEVEK